MNQHHEDTQNLACSIRVRVARIPTIGIQSRHQRAEQIARVFCAPRSLPTNQAVAHALLGAVQTNQQFRSRQIPPREHPPGYPVRLHLAAAEQPIGIGIFCTRSSIPPVTPNKAYKSQPVGCWDVGFAAAPSQWR